MTSHAERRAAVQRERAAALTERLDALLQLRGDERVLDVGAGTGAFAFAIADRVREVVAVEVNEELAERARADAPPNVQVVVADAEHLPFERATFDLGGTLRMLHHTRRPEQVISELARVTRPGGIILVVDQLAPVDPLEAFELTRFERTRDPSTTRILADSDLRALFDSNGLTLRRQEFSREPRDLDAYLDLAGCEGEDRNLVRNLAPTGYEAVVGWYVLAR